MNSQRHQQKRLRVIASLVIAIAGATLRSTVAFVPKHSVFGKRMVSSSSSSLLMTEKDMTKPTTFREAEVLGLRLMQQGNYEEALKGKMNSHPDHQDNKLTHSLYDTIVAFQDGLQLKGSRQDVIRTKRLSGPSPVGGSTGGMESRNVETLDEFELQAAYYNMACAQSQLGNLAEAVVALQTAFDNGFDNFATVRGDPDLDPIKGEKEFEKLMKTYEPKMGFNPFGLFGKGNK